ncbi:hypothetical protein [Sphingomonas kyungheensis]|uniref:Uncharacterized protein n=1 Tax=Sphingomonas kyungheensis TaxID=1069987 RepID=A0ABU8H4M8_9SPHN
MIDTDHVMLALTIGEPNTPIFTAQCRLGVQIINQTKYVRAGISPVALKQAKISFT